MVARSIRILVFVLCIAVTPAHAGSFGQLCFRVALAIGLNLQAEINRAKTFLPNIVANQSNVWAKKISRPPESLNGLTEDQAIRLLEELRGKWFTTLSGDRLRNSTVKVRLSGGQAALIKTKTLRTAGDDKIYTFSTAPRYEVVAFILDRYLGTNLVPPAIDLGDGRIAELVVDATPSAAQRLEQNPANLMEMSHLRMLDILVSNGDRNMEGNTLQGQMGEVVGADFDLAKPYYPEFGNGAPPNFLLQNVLIEPDHWIARSGGMPGVIKRSVYEKLVALDESTLLEISSKRGLPLARVEIQSILRSRDFYLSCLQRWSQIYGVQNIIIE